MIGGGNERDWSKRIFRCNIFTYKLPKWCEIPDYNTLENIKASAFKNVHKRYKLV